jgi:hypothetical protein
MKVIIAIFAVVIFIIKLKSIYDYYFFVFLNLKKNDLRILIQIFKSFLIRMNSNDIYLSVTAQNNINLDNQKLKIKDNEIQKLISMISELRDLRNEYITDFSKDTSIRNRYRGQILSSSRGSCMTIDLDKSIEYEAILTASLQLIKKNRTNNWLYIIFILNIWFIILYILKEYY